MKITLPLMKTVIQMNVTMAIIAALKQMETVYLLIAGIHLFPLIWLVDFSLVNPNELFTSGILVWP